ncbi:hypothetical protein RDABS01_005502 [Bienertia sinuspersici]
MELTNLNFNLTTSITHFNHPTFNTINRFTRIHHSLILKAIDTPSILKTTHLRQPNYKPITISVSPPPQQQNNNKTCINSNHNTILDVLRLMDVLGIVVSPDIYAYLIEECTQKRDSIQAKQVYAHMKHNPRIVSYLKGYSGLCLLNRVLLMLVTCSCFDLAYQLFDEMPHRNSVSLSIVIAGLVEDELYEQALRLFVKMHKWFVYESSDVGLQVVVVCFLKACLHLKKVDLVKTVHGWLLKMGYDRGLFVDTSLVEFYGKSGCLWEANNVFFDHIQMGDRRDTVLWTGAIVNNCRGRCFEEVIRIFQDMGEVGVKMNEYTFSTVLKACRSVGDDGSFGQQIHANAVKLGFGNHVFLLCALISMYGRCGLLKDAKKAFAMIDDSKRSRACWNAMISGFIQHDLYIEAIKMMYQMKAAGLQPQKSMVDEVRLACGSLRL